LTAQQHAALRENADLVVFMPPAWADNTKFNVTGILKKWKAYVGGIQSKFPLAHAFAAFAQILRAHEAWRMAKRAENGSERDGHVLPPAFVRDV